MGASLRSASHLRAYASWVYIRATQHQPDAAGAMVALMGASGSGKTTFMNTVIDRVPYGIPEVRSERRAPTRVQLASRIAASAECAHPPFRLSICLHRAAFRP